MTQQIEWVKLVIRLCCTDEIEESKKEELFTGLNNLYQGFSEEEQNQAEEILLSQLQETDAIYVYSQMNFYVRNKSIQKSLFKAILREDFNCFHGSMVELQTKRYIDDFYKEHHILRTKNIKKWEETLGDSYTFIPAKQRNRKRIVIVTEQLLGILHSPTQVVLNFSYILQEKLGYEVMLFICPSNAIISQDYWYKPISMASMEVYQYLHMKREYREAIFEGYQINMSPTCAREYSMMFQLIQAWNPIFVFSIGTANPIVDLISNFTTLAFLGLELSCPVSKAQILVRLGKMDEVTEEEYVKDLNPDQKQIFLEEKIPVLTEKSERQLRRQDYGLPESNFLIALVGNRLDLEIDLEFIQIMKNILDKLDSIAFVVIGNVSKLQNFFEEEQYKNRIFYLGFCEDLMATYGMLDLYLNPKRGGGGFSSAMALTAGIPVVTLPNCDVSYNVGDTFTVSDTEIMEKEICRYAEDKDFYHNRQKYALEFSKKNSVEKLEIYVSNIVKNILNSIS